MFGGRSHIGHQVWPEFQYFAPGKVAYKGAGGVDTMQINREVNDF